MNTTKNWMLDQIKDLIEKNRNLSDDEWAKKITIHEIEHSRYSLLQTFGKAGKLHDPALRAEAIKLDYDLKWRIKELGEEPANITY